MDLFYKVGFVKKILFVLYYSIGAVFAVIIRVVYPLNMEKK